MALIDPFGLDPDNPVNRLILYWYATVNRVIYQDDNALTFQVMDLAGGTLVTGTLGFPPLIPRVEVWSIPADKRFVVIRGTTQWQEYLFEVMGSFLVSAPPWDGTVNQYFRQLADTIRAQFAPYLLPAWALTGHSLGGAVGALVSRYGATPETRVLVDFGSPRSGDGVYSSHQVRPDLRWRITNEGDPVPLIPPSTNTLLDELPAILPIPVPPVYYRHWGRRIHLFQDGTFTLPVELSTSAEVALAIIQAVRLGTNWYIGHDTAEYARRLRSQIPVAFRIGPDPDFPGLYELDQINFALNTRYGIIWHIRAGAGDSIRRELPGGQLVPPIFAPEECT